MKHLYCLLMLFSLSAMASPLIDKNYLKLEAPNNKYYGIYQEFLSEAKKGNTRAIESLFDLYQKSLDPYYRTKLTYDLFSVFVDQPYLYIETSDKFFKSEVCSYATLLTEYEENKVYQVEWVLNKAKDKKKSKKYLERLKNYDKLKDDEMKTKRTACFKK